MRVWRRSWIEAGVSGSPETVHSAPEVNTCNCRPDMTARTAFAWSASSGKAMASSSSPSPGSKSKKPPERESQSRSGSDRDPPMTSLSWWNTAETGQPRRAEKAGSRQSAVAALPPASAPVTSASASVAETTRTIRTSSLPIRKGRPASSAAKTSAEAVSRTRPEAAEAASVTEGAA